MKDKVFFKTSIGILLFLGLVGQDDSLLAQNKIHDSSKNSFGLFEDDKLIEISLRFDLSTYFRTKPKEDYLKANITFHISKSDSVSQDIRLKTRGVFRNKYCKYPPIELNFKKANFGYSDLNKISKIKLVPQCSSGKENEDYVLKEYLAYKLFNVLTDTSFRVRLLKVTYIDTQKKRKPIVQYGFFIEPVEILLARTNCIQIKTPTLTQKNIIPKIIDRLAIFNFMIGNYDWAVPGQHNILVIKSLKIDPYGLAIAIPHDFDWTGLVNASYAIPAEVVGTENVRERLFLGICRTEETYQRDLDTFVEKKDEFYNVIKEFPYLNQQVKKDLMDYLAGFFDQLDGNRKRILYNFMNSCKNF
jgi:hypothetical protein